MKQRNSKKKSNGKNKKNRSNRVARQNEASTTNWIDQLMFFEPIESDAEERALSPQSPASASNNEAQDIVVASQYAPTMASLPNNNNNNNNNNSLSVLSWNVLAEAYCSPRSHPHLPPSYRKVVFDRSKRRQSILHILKNKFCHMDVLCLQEVDMDEIGRTLRECGFVGVETPRTSGGHGGKCDACGIYVNQQTYELVEHELVRFDDLATLCSSDSETAPQQNGVAKVAINGNSSLHGMQQSFLRKKTALLARIRHKTSAEMVVISNAHLFWDPHYEYVKLCQAHYLLVRAKRFCNGHPVAFCGDWNSRPHGAAHTYLTSGTINAKRVAPWYQERDGDGEDRSKSLKKEPDGPNDEVQKLLGELSLSPTAKPTRVRYLLDATLNKLCRWLRILGQDTALETDEEEKMRTGEGNMLLFDRCKDERRTLVTTSTRLMQRRDCPPGTYCINPTFLSNLEVALVHILLTHGVVLEPSAFLGRCVVCNGDIVEVDEFEEKRSILREYQAPEDLLKDDMDVYECDKCQQGYWWCDKPTSSASRVKEAATRLFRLCVRAGIPVRGELGMFDHVDIDAEREKGWDYSIAGSELLDQQLDVVGWLRDEELSNPFGGLESTYGQKDNTGNVLGEILPFTNVTHGFVDVLDYIFASGLSPTERLRIPTTFPQLNSRQIKNGHILPSDIWPSDHLAIGAKYILVNANASTLADNSVPEEESLWCSPTGSIPMPVDQMPHGVRCECGCVPRIPSLFEMAELRRQARQKSSEA